jgi:DNA-binding transcriptional LysR family regulator
MPVSLRLLRYFVAAAQSGSTTAAANELSVSQPSISVAVRELEALFGEDLFARGPGTKMSLTRFGTRKLDEARRLLKAAAAFEADDGGDPTRGEVQIGVFRRSRRCTCRSCCASRANAIRTSRCVSSKAISPKSKRG